MPNFFARLVARPIGVGVVDHLLVLTLDCSERVGESDTMNQKIDQSDPTGQSLSSVAHPTVMLHHPLRRPTVAIPTAVHHKPHLHCTHSGPHGSQG